MRTFKRFRFSIIIFLFLLIFYNFSALSQFGLDKLKKAGENVKNNKTNSECQAVSDLKNRFKLIQDVLNSKDFTFWKMHHEYAEQYLKEIKEKCPTVDPKPYEEELKSYEKQYAELSAGAEKDKKIREEAVKELEQANYDIDFLMYMSGMYKGMLGKKYESTEFYNKCKKIDYPVRKPRIEKYAQEIPDFSRENSSEKTKVERFLKEFPQKLEQLFNDFISGEINLSIENAYSLKSKGKSGLSEALAAAEAGLLVADAILLIVPDHSKCLQLKKDAKTVYDKIDSEFGTSVYTSKFHKENVGKLLLSKSPIIIKQENPGAITDKFKASDYIYGMFYLKGTFKELTRESYKLIQKIEVDGVEKISRYFVLQDDNREATYLTTEIIADPKTAQTKGVVEYSKALSILSPRLHKVKVSLIDDFGGQNILAQGEFDLDCSEGMESLEKTAKQLADNELKKVVMPKAGMKDAKLEKEILMLLTDWKEKPLRAVITSKDWTINRNTLTGIIEFRSIWSAVAFKTPDGQCKIFYLSFKQPYKGKGYGKTESWGVGDSEMISCENVNK
jgi:hypothetical protein